VNEVFHKLHFIFESVWSPALWRLHAPVSAPLMSAVKTPAAATPAQTSNAVWKPVRNLSCMAAVSTAAPESLLAAPIRLRPASGPPRPAKIAPANATLKL